ncbi:MAG: glycosyltransferase family 4 protein [Microcystis aeruginosa F13-15]|jgi:glycosyltransferase involved in cell wall biosynthesis|nr:glycosyltransferase family 4 protein [Microcystis aeruginosa F13-15]
MRILIVTTQTPFIHGGAEIHAEELLRQLQKAGHEAEIVAIPFQVYPQERILDSMLVCRLLDLSQFAGWVIDRVIALKFPAYLVPHPRKVLWILHQHRQAYEMWNHPQFGDLYRLPNGQQIKSSIERADNHAFAESHAIFSNSRNVANRLKQFNGIDSLPLYHPPQKSDCFYCEPEEGFFFFPSRFNEIKRQTLVLEALAQTTYPVKVIFAGQSHGNFRKAVEQMIQDFGLEDRVTLAGCISVEQKLDYYAKSLAVIYPPFDEDYGYVTLEGMLAAKPVITCWDSGGPLEFIHDRQTGLVTEPNPTSLAKALDELWENRSWAKTLGKAALDYYQSLDITWSNVLEKLLK